MMYLSKAYYRKRCEDKEDELREVRKVINEKDQVIRFLLEEPNPYRIKIAPGDWCWVGDNSISRTRLEYVDGQGVYHNYVKNWSPNKIEILSTDKDTAILKLCTETDKHVYFILNKAAETTTEISQDTLMKICDIEVASLLTSEMRRLINHGK